MRKFLLSMAIAGGSLFMATAPAFAGTVSSPGPDESGSYLVANSPTDPDGPGGPLEPGWTPASFDITASDFPVGSIVYVQICSGVDPSTPGWDPVADCDAATVPSEGFADASGSFTFSVTNENYRLPMFRGDSPAQIFQCVAPDEDLNDIPNELDLPRFDNCQIRVSSNHLGVTSDQSFLRFRLTKAGVGPDPEIPEVPFAVLLPLSALAVGGGLLIVRKRRMAGSVVA